MTDFRVEEIAPRTAAVVRAEVPLAEIPSVFDRAYPEIMRVVAAQGRAVTGPPFGLYPRMPTDTVEVLAGFPVDAPIRADGDVEPFELPGGRAVVGVHVGPYDTLEGTYAQLADWAGAQGLTLAAGMWETYLSDPSAEPDPATWRTLLTWPVA